MTRIFFPHWSFIIPSKIYDNYECVIFHMTDLPFGRGRHPLQNLISRGLHETKITAFRCDAGIDSGPVYLKASLSLGGTAQEIYIRATKIIENMIITIIKDSPKTQEQEGDIVVFNRRTEADNCLDRLNNLAKVYDYIHMLDANGYSNAFIESETLRFEFRNASIKEGAVTADVKIQLRSKNVK